MDTARLYAQIDELLDCAPGTVTGTETLSDLDGWDSLAVLGFVALADSEYGIILPAKEIAKCKTVRDLEALLRAAV